MSKKLSAKELAKKLSTATPEEVEALLQGFMDAAAGEVSTAENKAKEAGEKVVALTSSVNDLKGQISAADNKFNELKKDHDKAVEDKNSALSVVNDLSEQIAAQSKIVDQNKKVVTIGKKKFYLEGASFIIPGIGSVTADELANDEDALADLLKKESSILTPVS